jgi:cytoskeleton protein RodZ
LPVSLPVSVVVGRSDAIQLSVQGQPFDLMPHTQINTARFEVKP